MLRTILFILISIFAMISNSQYLEAKKKTIKSKSNIDFDSIIFQHSPNGRSARGKKGRTLILNIDKSVLFYTSDNGFVKGKADTKIFNELMRQLVTLDIDTVKKFRAIHSEPGNIYAFTFMKNGIVKDYVRSYQACTTPAMQKFQRTIFQLTNNITVTEKNAIPLPPKFKYCHISHYAINENLTDAKFILKGGAGFLLFTYLCDAKVVTDKTLQESFYLYKMNLRTAESYRDSTKFSQININNEWQFLRKVETDGRYFRFTAESGESITLDIGVNFFTHTVKNEYEKWILEN